MKNIIKYTIILTLTKKVWFFNRIYFKIYDKYTYKIYISVSGHLVQSNFLICKKNV